MAVGLDVLGGLQTELYGRVELAGDTQRELTVWTIACRELFAGYNQPHILRQASVAVADSASERQHRYLAHRIARPTEGSSPNSVGSGFICGKAGASELESGLI